MINFLHRLKVKGLGEMSLSILDRIYTRQCSVFNGDDYLNKTALEIGDATPWFCKNSIFPVYNKLASLDRVLKTSATPWCKFAAQHNNAFLKDNPPPSRHGNFITCATILTDVPKHFYDVVLSSHVLEHICNPLKALKSWHSVLKPGGKLVLLVPRRTMMNDHARPQTTFVHLLSDLYNDTEESDETHIEEFCRLYDMRMFTGKNRPSDNDIIEMATRNHETAIAHIHTWDACLTLMAVRYSGFKVDSWCHHPPFHIVVVATAI